MLKLKLTKDEHAKLGDAFKPEYKADGENFVLDTDVPFEDVTGLKSALATQKEQRLAATNKVKELETQVTTLTEEKETLTARAKSPGDVEKSYQAKVAKLETDAKTEREKLTGQLRNILVDGVATQIATEISTAPHLLTPVLKNRLSIEEVDGKFITRVLDSEGKASALSVNEFKEEILANKDYAPILTASKASGGGNTGKQMPPDGKAFNKMSESELTALYHKVGKVEFDRLKAQSESAA